MNIPLDPDGVLFDTYQDVHAGLFNRELAQEAHKQWEKDNILEDVVMQLHAVAHRNRRRIENPVFRREAVQEYERAVFPGIIQDHLDLMIERGYRDAVKIGHTLTIFLSALISGVDLTYGSLEEADKLVEYERVFVQGASITDSTRDKDEVRAEVRQALRDFEREFYTASRARRNELVARYRRGELVREELPADVLTNLLLHQEDLGIDDALVLRETAFFLESGSHTSSLSLANTLHNLFQWAEDHPERWRAHVAAGWSDFEFVQRSVHEAVRLHPIIPVSRRRAVADIEIAGQHISPGTVVYLDNVKANRDPQVFGPDAETFNPDRVLPPGVQPFAHSFSGGMHACIGRVLAAGVPGARAGHEEAPPGPRVYGQVALMAQALLQRGAEPDRERPPVDDPTTHRTRWLEYPVRFARDALVTG